MSRVLAESYRFKCTRSDTLVILSGMFKSVFVAFFFLAFSIQVLGFEHMGSKNCIGDTTITHLDPTDLDPDEPFEAGNAECEEHESCDADMNPPVSLRYTLYVWKLPSAASNADSPIVAGLFRPPIHS